jgi:putative Flp pilus-assembly TadE/G-like protein
MRARNDRGQATVLTLVFLVVLLGMAALVLDIGSWYRADRAAQSTVDAAALAGAQALPTDPGGAGALAVQYSDKNGGGVSAGDITITGSQMPNDTIKVKITRPATGVFTKLFGVNSVTVGAKASARTGLMNQAKYVAPIGVNLAHPKLKGTSTCPCFGSGNLTTLPLGKTGVPGGFDVINVDSSRGGTGPSTLAAWILKGLDAYMPLGDYYSDAGAKWNSSQIGDALDKRLGTELLFPVYDIVKGTGSNAQYHVVGWVGFHLTAHEEHGSDGSITGWFTEVVWTGIQATSSSGQPYLGARTVQLVD